MSPVVWWWQAVLNRIALSRMNEIVHSAGEKLKGGQKGRLEILKRNEQARRVISAKGTSSSRE